MSCKLDSNPRGRCREPIPEGVTTAIPEGVPATIPEKVTDTIPEGMTITMPEARAPEEKRSAVMA